MTATLPEDDPIVGMILTRLETLVYTLGDLQEAEREARRQADALVRDARQAREAAVDQVYSLKAALLGFGGHIAPELSARLPRAALGSGSGKIVDSLAAVANGEHPQKRPRVVKKPNAESVETYDTIRKGLMEFLSEQEEGKWIPLTSLQDAAYAVTGRRWKGQALGMVLTHLRTKGEPIERDETRSGYWRHMVSRPV